MEIMTIEQFKKAIKDQGRPIEQVIFRCPMCGKIQSAQDLIDAGAGENFDEVEKYLAFTCVGRFTGAGAPRKEKDGMGCNWTLGGLFQCQELTVVTTDGKNHPRFMPVQ